MPVSVNEIREKFAQLKYEQLLADKYFIETCFSKNFESRTAREKMDDMKMRIKAHRLQREGITMIDCHLPQTGCDSEGMETTTTTIPPQTTTTTVGIR